MTYVDPLATSTLTNPLVVQMRQDVALAINSARPGFLADAMVLTEAIADITFDLAVQGASFMEVTVIDPGWQLFRDSGNGNGAFIDVDPSGYLLPINMEFPKGSDRWWYLVAANPTSDLTQGNVKLTFEDHTVEVLRSHDKDDGPAQSNPDETRLEFILRLLKTAQISVKEIFSQPTIDFEQSPPSFTPQQVVDWDKQWTRDQQQKRADAAKTAAALAQLQQNVKEFISSLTTPATTTAPTGTGTTAQNQWWAKNAPGAENPNSADYVPNAGYIPGLGTNP